MPDLASMNFYTMLYTLSSAIIAVSYIPQLWVLVFDRSHAQAISLLTAFLWTFTTMCSVLYAVKVNGDFYFILCSAINFIGCAGIFILSVYNRFFKPDYPIEGDEAHAVEKNDTKS